MRRLPFPRTATFLVVLATSAGCIPGERVRARAPVPVPRSVPLPIGQPIIPPPAWVDSVEAPARDVLEVLTGEASYYSDALAGNRTASGERYDPNEMTAAHPSLPFGTRLRVTSLVDGSTVEVRVTDRGPFAKGRVLDLSRRAAEQLGMIRRGHIDVLIEVLSYGPSHTR